MVSPPLLEVPATYCETNEFLPNSINKELIHTKQDDISLLTQDVFLIQRLLNVLDVRWMLKQWCVLTGLQSSLQRFAY